MDKRSSTASKEAGANTDSGSEKEVDYKSTENTCLQCGHRNDKEASFCEECGVVLVPSLSCRRCGGVARSGAEICEICGEWLYLEGLCKFCYNPIEGGELYCNECGHPLAGISCPSCHNVSYSEFCEKCHAALTEVAHKAIVVMREDVEALRHLSDDAALPKQDVHDKHVDIEITNDLDKLRAYKATCNLESQAKGQARSIVKNTSLFSSAHKANIDKLNAEVLKEEQRLEEIRRQEEERQRIEEEIRRIEAEHKKKIEERQRLERQGNVIFIKNKNVTITVQDENCAYDDDFMLFVNDSMIGLIDHGECEYTSYKAVLEPGENTIKLALHRIKHNGSAFTVSVMPGGRKLTLCGSNDHYIKVQLEE